LGAFRSINSNLDALAEEIKAKNERIDRSVKSDICLHDGIAKLTKALSERDEALELMAHELREDTCVMIMEKCGIPPGKLYTYNIANYFLKQVREKRAKEAENVVDES
jgi:hypothetical protein